MEVSSETIEEMIDKPKEFTITEINVLRNSNKELPENNQVGPTCGIYALQAAIDVLGKKIAPRKRAFNNDDDGDWRAQKIPRENSIRRQAKTEQLTQIGEISGVADMQKLAASLGINVGIEPFKSDEELWKLIVESVNLGNALVFPYTAASTIGEPAWSKKPGDFTHWCLLFGYTKYMDNARFVFMTTYGYYHQDRVDELFKSNQAIEDWKAQTWVKLTWWINDPAERRWEKWKSEWIPNATLREQIKGMAEGIKDNDLGFGFGTKDNLIHTLKNPHGPLNLTFTDQTLKSAFSRSVELEKIEYSKTMSGRCVVVKNLGNKDLSSMVFPKVKTSA